MASDETYSPGVHAAISAGSAGGATEQAKVQGRRASTTGPAQEARIAWGKYWGAVASDAAKRAREGA